MNKQNNRLALSVLAALITGIALIYTFIMYHHIIYAVAGVSVIFLICAFILTKNLIAFSTMQNKSLNVHIKDCIDDISSQLEAMNSAQSKIGKATYIYTRHAAQTVSTLENNYIESQDALFKNLTSLSNTQNKAIKLIVKHNQNNTIKLITSMKDLSSQLNETFTQGLDQTPVDNAEIITALEEIVSCLKPLSDKMDEAMGIQLGNVAAELQNISDNIQQIRISTENTIPSISADNIIAKQESLIDSTNTMIPESEMVAKFTEPEIPESDINTELTESDTSEPEINTELTESDSPEPGINTKPTEPDTLEFGINAEPAEPDTLEFEINAAPAESDISEPNINTELTEPDIPESDINAGPAESEVITNSASESFTPTFTVVGKSASENPKPKAFDSSQTTATKNSNADSNKQLSSDEIAALFAAADPAPKKESKPVKAAVKEEPVSENPNKQLSADEIAALFAAADPAPKKEEVIPEPVEIKPVSDDPNKQLSADEIAALFSSLG